MKKTNDILKLALTPNDEPDPWLNQEILSKAKEANRMEKRRINQFAAVALSAALVLGISSVTIYAAKKLLLPQEVVHKIGDTKLLEAFSGNDAILVNQTQSYGGYDVTLYGVISGKGLSDFKTFSEDGIHDDRTYAVVSIQKSDQTPLPSTSDDAYSDYSFLVSPFIEGYNPVWYNSFTLLGGYSELEKDGVFYRISECDNIEIFADHKIYLGVSEGTFYDNNAYTFNEETGEIRRNESYDGLNALFELPLDPSKADPKAAAEYIKSIDAPDSESTEDTDVEGPEPNSDIEAFISQLTPDNLADYATPVESSIQTGMPDEEGSFHYECDLGDRGGASGTIGVQEIFPDNKPGMSDRFSYSYSDSIDSLMISTFTLNEDGSITYTAYIPK